MSVAAATIERGEERRLALARALPLALLYGGLVGLYAWQAWVHRTPTLFTDELEFTQLSRSIAESGEPTLRGAPVGWVGLYTWLAAPLWWLGDVGTAYGAIKLLGVLLMTAAVFPAYGLARLVVSPPWALAAAAGAGMAPALAYSPFLVEEPLAYPLSTLALWLTARWAARGSAAGLVLAAAACVLAALARTQLATLLAVLGLTALAVLWRSAPARRWWSRWTAWDWVGAATLAVTAAVAAGAFASHRSFAWYVTTTFYKERMLEYGLWAFGALAVGVGVLPFVAGLAALVPARGARWPRERVAFTTVAAAALASFAVYTAVKAAYLSTTLAVLVVERNLIYLVPVLFAGTAVLLERREARPAAVAAAAALAVSLVLTTPLVQSYPYYEAQGLSIAALANRLLEWPAERIERSLVAVALVAAALLLALVAVRVRPPLARALAAALMAVSLAWALTAEIYAANGERRAADRLYATLPKPADWLDRLTGGERAVFLGQGVGSDASPIWSLEFWNRSLEQLWSLDGSAPGPGRVTTPDLAAPDGTLTPDPEADWVVLLRGSGVDLALPGPATEVGIYAVLPLEGPLRLRQGTTGVSASDGWMGGAAAHNRYDVPPGERGLAEVVLSRSGWCDPTKDVPGNVTVEVGPVAVGPQRQPVLARVTDRRTAVINACETLPLLLRTPGGPWRAEVTVEPTFSPRELDPGLADARQLGAVVTFGYRPAG